MTAQLRDDRAWLWVKVTLTFDMNLILCTDYCLYLDDRVMFVEGASYGCQRRVPTKGANEGCQRRVPWMHARPLAFVYESLLDPRGPYPNWGHFQGILENEPRLPSCLVRSGPGVTRRRPRGRPRWRAATHALCDVSRR